MRVFFTVFQGFVQKSKPCGKDNYSYFYRKMETINEKYSDNEKFVKMILSQSYLNNTCSDRS